MNNSNNRSLQIAMRSVLGACACIVALGLSGCSAPKVHTEHNTAVNLSAYKTFAVLPFVVGGAGANPGDAIRLTNPAQQAVRDSLSAKGLSEVPRDKADCAVSVRGEALPRVEVTGMGYTTYPVGVRRRGWVYYGGVHSVDVNTTMDRKLIIEVFDNATHQPAWVGWTEHSGGGSVKADKLRDEIQRVLTGFPPAPKSP